MPTYVQHNGLAYNLIQDTREVGDTKTLSREQLGRSNFTRDQMLAANTIGFDRSTMIKEAARGNSRLRNLHQQMGNTSTTGGFGGLGYAPGKNDIATKDYAMPSDGNSIKCLLSMGTISGAESNYLLLSQTICKPHTGIYGRYAEASGIQGFITKTKTDDGSSTVISYALSAGPENMQMENDYRDVPRPVYPRTAYIDSLTYVSKTSNSTTLQAESAVGSSDDTQLTIPVSLDPTTTYWFVRLYNKTTGSEELLSVPYSACDLTYFGAGVITNNYPNMALSRTKTFDQAYFDANKGDVETYPTSAERDSYFALHQAELDTIATDITAQSVIVTQAQASQDTVFTILATLTDEQQDYITQDYFSKVRPALVALGLNPITYTQIELDALRVVAEDPEDIPTLLYIDDIEISQAGLEAALPTEDAVALYHTFDAAVPYMLTEHAAVDALEILQTRKYTINTGAPKSDLIENQFYSEWGDWTFFQDYRNKWGDTLELFMSEGFPQHDEVKRFISMLGQNPRSISDVVKHSVQTDPDTGGNARTLCDQLIFGCQATTNMDYAEMRYAIEFARSAWWNTPWSSDTSIDSRKNEDVFNDAGQSAWGIQHIEESMINPGHPHMKSTRTRWGSCEVWIEAGQVEDGEFGLISMTQTMAEQLTTRGDNYYHATGVGWVSDPTGSQEIVGTYNIDNGYVLKIKITGLQTLAYTYLDSSGSPSTNSYIEYPIIPLFYNILRGIPQTQICQIQNEFMFIRSHTEWTQYRSSWVEFRDNTLMKIVGLIIAVVGVILAIPSGGLTLTWTTAGTALMYAAIAYAAMRVIAHFMKQWGLDNTWIGAVVATVMAAVAIYFGMPPTDAILLSTTVTADAMTFAYNKVNLAEAKEHAGIMDTYDDTLSAVTEKLEDLEEQQNWLDFYSASDLVAMRQKAVDYVRQESPDKYYERMMGFNDNKLNLNGLEYTYDHGLDLELT